MQAASAPTKNVVCSCWRGATGKRHYLEISVMGKQPNLLKLCESGCMDPSSPIILGSSPKPFRLPKTQSYALKIWERQKNQNAATVVSTSPALYEMARIKQSQCACPEFSGSGKAFTTQQNRKFRCSSRSIYAILLDFSRNLKRSTIRRLAQCCHADWFVLLILNQQGRILHIPQSHSVRRKYKTSHFNGAF